MKALTVEQILLRKDARLAALRVEKLVGVNPAEDPFFEEARDASVAAREGLRRAREERTDLFSLKAAISRVEARFPPEELMESRERELLTALFEWRNSAMGELLHLTSARAGRSASVAGGRPRVPAPEVFCGTLLWLWKCLEETRLKHLPTIKPRPALTPAIIALAALALDESSEYQLYTPVHEGVGPASKKRGQEFPEFLKPWRARFATARRELGDFEAHRIKAAWHWCDFSQREAGGDASRVIRILLEQYQLRNPGPLALLDLLYEREV